MGALDRKKIKLNERQRIFVAEYLKDGNGTRAARVAGYSQKNSQQTACALLKNSPAVKNAIETARQSLTESASYNMEKAMAEAADVMAFAKETKNANALAKAVELRSKLSGLLIERQDVRHVGKFELIYSGIDEKEVAPTGEANSDEENLRMLIEGKQE